MGIDLEEYNLHQISLTFSWRSRNRPAQTRECQRCSSEEEESIRPVEGEEERGKEREREGRRERERERERDVWLRHTDFSPKLLQSCDNNV